jgi:hypothetical protein
MNKSLTQYIPFGSRFGGRRQNWHEKYLSGSNRNVMLSVLGGIGLGAGLMYIFDPDRGARRRGVARDKITSAVNRTGETISSKSRDLSNRARGVIAETGSLLRRDETKEQSRQAL